jgi:hypothetical protein
LGNKITKYRAYSICQVAIKGLNLSNYEGYISGELAYDLEKAEAILTGLPEVGICKLFGRRVIGSVIRICKAIEQPVLADNIHKLVENCFIPHEEQDTKDFSKFLFDLYVEPSTGGIQCDCCK